MQRIRCPECTHAQFMVENVQGDELHTQKLNHKKCLISRPSSRLSGVKKRSTRMTQVQTAFNNTHTHTWDRNEEHNTFPMQRAKHLLLSRRKRRGRETRYCAKTRKIERERSFYTQWSSFLQSSERVWSERSECTFAQVCNSSAIGAEKVTNEKSKKLLGEFAPGLLTAFSSCVFAQRARRLGRIRLWVSGILYTPKWAQHHHALRLFISK